MQFDNEDGETFRKACAEYCRNQAYALEELKKQKRKEQRLSLLLYVSYCPGHTHPHPLSSICTCKLHNTYTCISRFISLIFFVLQSRNCSCFNQDFSQMTTINSFYCIEKNAYCLELCTVIAMRAQLCVYVGGGAEGEQYVCMFFMLFY